MIAGALEIQLLANVARLAKDMQDAKGAVTSAMGSIEKTVGIARTALGALGVGLSVNYFKNFVTGAIEAQDELGKMSQRVGVSVERLAGLEHAAGMSGTSLGTLEKGLKTVSSGLYDASNGSKGAQENFDALGVSIYDTNGQLKSADAVMIEVADQFAKLEDGTQKTALATKVFGRAGLELIPMLNEGSAGMAALVAEGQKYNPVTAESAAQAEIFNDNLDRLTAAGKGMGLAFVNNILPALAAFSQWAVDLSNGDTAEYLDTVKAAAAGLAVVLVTQVVPAFSVLAGPIGIATAAVVAMVAAYDNLQRITNTAHENSVSNNIANGAEVITFAMYNVVQEINKAAEAMDNLGGGRSAKARREELQAEIARLTLELERYALALADTKKPTADATAAATVAGTAVVAYGEDVKFTIDAHEAHVEALEEYRKEQDKAREANDKARQSIAGTIAGLEHEMLALQMTARAAAVFEAVTRATADGALPAEIAKIAEATARLYDMKEAKDQAAVSAGVLKKTNEDAAKAAADNWQRTHEYLSTTFIDIANNGGNAFDNIAKSFSAMIQRMVAEWAASKLMNIFGMGGGGTATGAMGSIFGGGGGGMGGGGAAGGAGGSLVNAAVSSGIRALIGGGGSAATSAAIGAGGAIGGVGAAAAGGTVAGGVGAAAAGGGAAAGGMLAGAGAAAAGAGSAIMGGLAAIPGWGWALGAAALIASQIEKETPSGNAGFLIRDLAGGGDGRTFDVDPFASGFDPVGFARREDQGAATAVIDTFRQYDEALTNIATAAGLRVNYGSNNFGGFNEKGQGGGLFFGSANEDGRSTSVPVDEQLTQFVGQWIKGLGGQVDQSLIADVLAAGSADEMLKRAAMIAGVDGSHANGLDYVPFDGYVAQTHQGEGILTAEENKNYRAQGPLMARLVDEVINLRRDLSDMIRIGASTNNILDKWDGQEGLVP
jgi:hypothetical protein